MQLHYLQHVPFEGIGSIQAWADAHGHTVSCTRLFAGEHVPVTTSMDLLVVMGGPMGIYDETEHPWLAEEKAFLKEVIVADTPIVGICLGAQLLADALGAAVTRNPAKEIGWFPIMLDPALSQTRWANILPEGLEVYHWHGDTFDIPNGAVPLASSAACENQGFVYEDRILSLQFHLEIMPEGAAALNKICAAELVEAPYIQTAEEMMADASRFEAVNRVMGGLLDTLVSKA